MAEPLLVSAGRAVLIGVAGAIALLALIEPTLFLRLITFLAII